MDQHKSVTLEEIMVKQDWLCVGEERERERKREREREKEREKG